MSMRHSAGPGRSLKKVGVKYAYFRSVRENDWYPHYIHNLDNLVRVGGLFPPVHVHADIRRTRLLGATHVYEGGCMMVRAKDDIYRMSDLKGKKVGLSKSLNTLKNDWWRSGGTGHRADAAANGMTREDVEIVEFPYPDDWYGDPKMLVPFENPTELWLSAIPSTTRPCARWKPRWKRAGSMRSIHKASTSSICRRRRAVQGDRGPVAVSGLDAAVVQPAGGLHLHRGDGRAAPRNRGRVSEGHHQGRAWCNQHRHAAAAILDKATST